MPQRKIFELKEIICIPPLSYKSKLANLRIDRLSYIRAIEESSRYRKTILLTKLHGAGSVFVQVVLLKD